MNEVSLRTDRGVRKWARRAIAPAFLALALGLSACSSGIQGAVQTAATAQAGASATPPAVSLQQSAATAPHATLAETIKRVLPSVVNVRVTQVGLNSFGGTQQSSAEGTGVVIDKNGTILTNNHVIAGAVKVTVLFNDGHASMQGTVVGADPQHDLAVVKVNVTDLTPIAIGHSGTLELGDQVTAIGFPLDLGGPTVTAGIVSGLNRTVSIQTENGVERLTGMLQTDAAINPGNSGGPLIDALGQLVGINTAGVQAGSAENVGFAIAIDEALPVIQQILTQPATKRAWLGVSAASVDSDAAAEQLGLPTSTRGAVVVSVVSGGPAEAAGIQQGDVIVSIGGATVRSSEDLSKAIANYSPGDPVKVGLVNASGTRTVTITFAQRPAGL